MIEARNLRKRYGATTAVDDLSFDVRPGMVTGLLGPDGAGKSTTIRLMLGLAGGAGETLFDGVPYRRLRRPLREVGVVHATSTVHPGRRARTHLRMLAATAGVGRRRVEEVIDWVGLAAVAGKRPRAYSQGMAQRLALAGALLGDPRVLILDEPAEGLDPAGGQWLRGFLRAYAAEGRTVLVSGRRLEELAGTADRLVVIRNGRLQADESADAFTSRSDRAGRVLVRTPHVERLRTLVAEYGAEVIRSEDHQLAVAGLDRATIGELAFRNGIVLHELAERGAALDETLGAPLALVPSGSRCPITDPVPRSSGRHAGRREDAAQTGLGGEVTRIPAQVGGPFGELAHSGAGGEDTQAFDVVTHLATGSARAVDDHEVVAVGRGA